MSAQHLGIEKPPGLTVASTAVASSRSSNETPSGQTLASAIASPPITASQVNPRRASTRQCKTAVK